MTFDVGADAYDRFMGRYSRPLAGALCDRLGLQAGQRVLDVGCGAGALTAALAGRIGAYNVYAVDPTQDFTRSVRTSVTTKVARAAAERLPFPDAAFDVAAAQLVVHFMSDPVAGLTEMGRVTKPGGVVAASVWDHGSGRGPLSTFWQAAVDLDPDAPDEAGYNGARAGHLAQLCADAGLLVLDDTADTVSIAHADFDEWWEPFTFGVGTAGAYVASRTNEQRSALRERCRELQPAGAFTVGARAWTVIARPA